LLPSLDMADEETLPPPKRVSIWVWLRIISGSAAVLCGSFGGALIALSIAIKNGFQIHPSIVELIEAYREAVYPRYEQLLLIGSYWFHINLHLSPQMIDIASLFVLAITAANVESFARDGDSIITNVVSSFFSTLYFDDMPWLFPSALRRKRIETYGASVNVNGASLNIMALVGVIAMTTLLTTYKWGFLAWAIFELSRGEQIRPIIGYIILAFAVACAAFVIRTVFLEDCEDQHHPELLRALRALLMPFALVGEVLLTGILLATYAASAIVTILLFILFSPLIAWRASLATTVIIVGVIVADRIAAHQWL